MRKPFLRSVLILALFAAVISCSDTKQPEQKHHTTSLRAPAYPLITIDPYTSAWSTTDNLFDSPVKHWTGRTHSLIGAVRVDGTVYRFLGKEEIPLKVVLPMAGETKWEGSYTFKAPKKGWEQSDFDASSWKKGPAAYGSAGQKAINTIWKDDKEIWVRREFTLPAIEDTRKLFIIYSHDDDFELYVNGTQVVNTGNRARSEVVEEIDPSLLKKDGKNVIAAHCLDRQGLAYVDFGILAESTQKEIFATAAVQDKVSLSATQTLYSFTAGPVALHLRFVSPLLPDDLDLLSTPINYVNYDVVSKDGKSHDVKVYFEMTPEWAVDQVDQEVEVSDGKTASTTYVKTGTTAQKILEKSGDNVRIDWGYAYLAAPANDHAAVKIGNVVASKEKFVAEGSAGESAGTITARPSDAMPALAYVDDLKNVDGKGASGKFMIAYDDIASIQYFGNNLKAWWAQGGATIDSKLDQAATGYDTILKRCIDFDNNLWDEAVKAGGAKYADLCVLAYRQAIAAHKLTKDEKGNVLFLSKENFSNGSIGTVDITYPSAPMFLKYNVDLVKGMMNPIFYFSESGKWTKPFAAHDVGTYPKANGQTYGGDMPVEESGNMLILTAAIAKQEGNADYAKAHWDVLTTWTKYLLKNGLDPENQLCTDDFAGHFAHNTNLSIKAIMGIASYGMLAEMLKKDSASFYSEQAARMAKEWEKMANDGDHYRLTFDKAGTWSQKYNMVWDKLLGFNILDKAIAKKELAYYLTKQNEFGLPLDNRRTYTKSDWIVWTATLADDSATFNKLIDPLHHYVTNTPSRVPMSDWYETPDGRQVGFQARSVVGGYFIKMLEQK